MGGGVNCLMGGGSTVQCQCQCQYQCVEVLFLVGCSKNACRKGRTPLVYTVPVWHVRGVERYFLPQGVGIAGVF